MTKTNNCKIILSGKTEKTKGSNSKLIIGTWEFATKKMNLDTLDEIGNNHEVELVKLISLENNLNFGVGYLQKNKKSNKESLLLKISSGKIIELKIKEVENKFIESELIDIISINADSLLILGQGVKQVGNRKMKKIFIIKIDSNGNLIRKSEYPSEQDEGKKRKKYEAIGNKIKQNPLTKDVYVIGNEKEKKGKENLLLLKINPDNLYKKPKRIIPSDEQKSYFHYIEGMDIDFDKDGFVLLGTKLKDAKSFIDLSYITPQGEVKSYVTIKGEARKLIKNQKGYFIQGLIENNNVYYLIEKDKNFHSTLIDGKEIHIFTEEFNRTDGSNLILKENEIKH